MELVKQAQLRIGVYWHVFPRYRDAKDTVWRDPTMLFNIIPPVLLKDRNETDLIVYFKNGSLLQLKGADDPDALRGPNPYGIVFDEFATMKRGAFDVVEPVLRSNGGWCWLVGTPKGKNHLFEFYQRGQLPDPEWKSWLLKASTSGLIDRSQLEASRKTAVSQAFFNQEWECEFLEGEGSVFRNVREAATSVPQKPQLNHLYCIGLDLAKVRDFTVISVFDRQTNGQVYQDRFQILEWPFQKKRIAAIARHYNNALITLDATGLGDPISDDLIREGLAVEPFKITEQSKKDLVEKLSIWIEQKKCRILPLQESLFEYDNFSYEIGPTGKIRYGAIEGFNDDIVLSHALGIWSLQPLLQVKVQSEVPVIRQAYLDRIKNTYGNEDTEGYDLEAVD